MPPPATQENLPTALLAEDSKTAAALIARHLKDLYNVVHACDGEDAWNQLCANPAVDLVITDIQMPRMTGHELLVKIRASDVARLKNVPIIVMTSAEESSERDLAFTNGANDFLTKPVDKTELLARASVHKQLNGTKKALETNQQTLQEQTTIDTLTGLKNRRALLEMAEGHLSLARRHRQHLSVIVLNIDQIDGEPTVKDSLLTGVAEILATATRTEDATARIGDEQFAILLPNTDGAGAAVLAERIRGAVEKKPFSVAGHAVAITVSAGIATLGVDETTGVDAMLQTAEIRRAIAKRDGGNRVVVSDDHPKI